jgi:D-3-phosphoglycerate dehydrogenase
MMFALARQIPQANQSTHAGKWEKSKFMGVELYAKTLGIIGCGNIGSIVASRALGLQMKVIAYDPFLTPDRARELGVEKVELDDLLARADFITIHVPKNEKTANLLNKDSIAKTKKGVRIINCARGGIIVEADLKEALDSGHVAGAALDVFETEPATGNVLFNHPNVVCTPHLGASTGEAQVNVAIQVAEQMSDYLNNGAVANAVNMPSITAEEAPKLKPYMKLSELLGRFAGQIALSAIQKIEVEYQGDAAAVNTRPLTAIVLASLLKSQLDSVNMVNAAAVAKARGIAVADTRTESSELHTAIKLTVTAQAGVSTITGTLFAGREPRIVEIEDVPIEAALTAHMLFIRNEDKPGMIGSLGTILANEGANIADFRLGRVKAGGTAVSLVSLDGPLSDQALDKLEKLPQIRQVQRLAFNV